MAEVDIVDVRVNDKAHNGAADIRQDVLAGLARPAGTRTLPTVLLYDERGLQLYDAMTSYAPEYYLFAAETSILQRHADEIVHAMRNHTANAESEGQDLVELGSG